MRTGDESATSRAAGIGLAALGVVLVAWGLVNGLFGSWGDLETPAVVIGSAFWVFVGIVLFSFGVVVSGGLLPVRGTVGVATPAVLGLIFASALGGIAVVIGLAVSAVALAISTAHPSRSPHRWGDAPHPRRPQS